MKRILFISLSLLSVCFAFGQDRLMFEAGGPAGYGSLNYVMGIEKARMRFEPRVGFGTYRLKGVEGKFHPDIIIPLGITVLPPRIMRVGLSVGITISGIQAYSNNDLETVWNTAGFESLSYNFISRERIRATAAFYLLNEPQKRWRPWAGLSFAYSLY